MRSRDPAWIHSMTQFRVQRHRSRPPSARRLRRHVPVPGSHDATGAGRGGGPLGGVHGQRGWACASRMCSRTATRCPRPRRVRTCGTTASTRSCGTHTATAAVRTVTSAGSAANPSSASASACGATARRVRWGVGVRGRRGATSLRARETRRRPSLWHWLAPPSAPPSHLRRPVLHDSNYVAHAAAAQLAGACDPTSPVGYSLIPLHARSHNVSDALAVARLVAAGGGGVEFVTPDVFVARVVASVRR